MKKGTKASKITKEKLSKAKIGNKNALNNEGGAPSKYQDIYPDMVLKYIKSCNDEYENVTKSENTETGGISYSNVLNVCIPKISAICILFDVSKDTIHAWEKLYVEFAAAMRKLRFEQEGRLFDCGLSGKYNARMAKFGLSANHGWSETQNVNYGGSIKLEQVTELPDDELRRITTGG